MTEKLHRLENERSSLNLQIQVLSEKLELQQDTLQEYEQLQRRAKPKYRNSITNTSHIHPKHVHQQPSFIQHVCILSSLSLSVSLEGSSRIVQKQYYFGQTY